MQFMMRTPIIDLCEEIGIFAFVMNDLHLNVRIVLINEEN